MTKEILEKEFEIRKLKNANKQLMNTNTLLSRQNKNLSKNFNKRVTEEVDKKVTFLNQEKTKEDKATEKVKTRTTARGLFKDYEQLIQKFESQEELLKENNQLIKSLYNTINNLNELVEKQAKQIEEQAQEILRLK